MPQPGAKGKQEEFTAAASVDRTPRVAIIPSDFRGSEEHDGGRIAGLAQGWPVRAALDHGQWEPVIEAALSHLGKRANTQPRFFGADEWVLLIAGVSFPAVVLEAVIACLAGYKLGLRFSVAGAPLPLEALRRRFPACQFDRVELTRETVVETPAPRNQTRVLRIPRTLHQCDRVVSLAAMGASALENFRPMAGEGEQWLDFARYHPPDLAVVASERPNLLVAGLSGLAVDAVAAALRGGPAAWFPQAEKLGLGTSDTDAIWTRGIEVEEGRKLFG